MKPIATRFTELASPRVLLALALIAGVLAMQAGRGTLAYFTSTTQTNGVFQAGTVNVSTSSLPASAALKWDSSGKGTACRVIPGATTGGGDSPDLTGQRLAPNEDCTTLVTLTNSGNLLANARLRLIRSSASGEANDALNSKLTLSLAELTGSVSGRGTTSDCTTTVDFNSLESNWTRLYDAAPIGTTGGLGVTGTLGAAPSGLSDDISGGKGKDLWGGTASDNAPNATKQLAGGASVNFCLRVAFPNAGLPSSNSTEDNAAQGGAVTYYFVADLIQAVGR